MYIIINDLVNFQFKQLMLKLDPDDPDANDDDVDGEKSSPRKEDGQLENSNAINADGTENKEGGDHVNNVNNTPQKTMPVIRKVRINF